MIKIIVSTLALYITISGCVSYRGLLIKIQRGDNKSANVLAKIASKDRSIFNKLSRSLIHSSSHPERNSVLKAVLHISNYSKLIPLLVKCFFNGQCKYSEYTKYSICKYLLRLASEKPGTHRLLEFHAIPALRKLFFYGDSERAEANEKMAIETLIEMAKIFPAAQHVLITLIKNGNIEHPRRTDVVNAILRVYKGSEQELIEMITEELGHRHVDTDAKVNLITRLKKFGAKAIRAVEVLAKMLYCRTYFRGRCVGGFVRTVVKRNRLSNSILDALMTVDKRTIADLAKLIKSRLVNRTGLALRIHSISQLIRAHSSKEVNDQIVNILMSSLQSKWTTIKVASINALGKLGPVAMKAHRVLGTYSENDNPLVRENAQRALIAIRPKTINDCLKALRTNDDTLRLTAIKKLARMGVEARDAVPILLKMCKSDDKRIKMAVARTLLKIGCKTSKIIYTLTSSLSSISRSLRNVVNKLLLKFGPTTKSTVPILVNFLFSKDNRLGAIAYKLLHNSKIILDNKMAVYVQKSLKRYIDIRKKNRIKQLERWRETRDKMLKGMRAQNNKRSKKNRRLEKNIKRHCFKKSNWCSITERAIAANGGMSCRKFKCYKCCYNRFGFYGSCYRYLGRKFQRCRYVTNLCEQFCPH